MTTPTATFLSHLLSLGLSHDQVVETTRLAEAAFTSTTKSSGSRRRDPEKERQRKAEYRARSGGGQVGDTASAISISDSKPIDDSDQKKNSDDECPTPDKKRSCGTAIPEDWKPAEELIAYGVETLKLTREEVLSCGEDMRLWGLANKNRAVARKENWRLTFMGWIRRAAPEIIRKRPRGPNGGGPTNAATRNTGGGFSTVAARIRGDLANRETFDLRTPGGDEPPNRH